MEIVFHMVSIAKDRQFSKSCLTIETLAGGSWQNEPGRVQEDGCKVRSDQKVSGSKNVN